MTTRLLAFLLSTTFALLAVFGADAVADAYGRCTKAVQAAKGGKYDEALGACREPAAAGVPGAQYAMGALTINAAGGKASAEAVQWLEKAVAQGHAGAAYVLAGVLGKDAAQRERVSQLYRMAVCGDYGPAVREMTAAGLTKEKLPCPARVDADFTGEWSGTLQWTKVSPGSGTGPELKIVVADGKASVFIKYEGAWREVKPGKFRVTQLEQTAVISAIDSGSDFDGVWIEAWDIHLLRLSADEAVLSYMRTVNNRDMPAPLSWRTFTTVAEGRVRRLVRQEGTARYTHEPVELKDLLAPGAGEFDVDEALESWRWLVPGKMRALVLSAAGDLFLTDGDGAVFFLDTRNGTCARVAASVAEWEGKIREPEMLEEWFMPGFVAELRSAATLKQGEGYSPVHPPILNGSFDVGNWPPTHWRAHFHTMGSIHEQIKDLPDGAVISKFHYTEL